MFSIFSSDHAILILCFCNGCEYHEISLKDWVFHLVLRSKRRNLKVFYIEIEIEIEKGNC